MPKYRKKPIVIEAVQWTGKNSQEIYDMEASPTVALLHSSGIDLPACVCHEDMGIVYVHTLEGTMKAEINDWIIKGISGEFYPCKPDIFEATYEEVV